MKYGWLLDRWFGSIMIMTKQEKLSSAQHQGCARYFPYEENRSCLILTTGRKNRVSCPSPFSAISAFVQSWSSRPAQSFQGSILIIDIATYRLNWPKGQCSENHLKCISRWEGRDGITITIFIHYTFAENLTSSI